MKKLFLVIALLLPLSACNDDENRVVVSAETPDGHPFHFMPIKEEGVTDITVTIAWPMSWAYETEENPAVPYLAAEAILSGGTNNRTPQDILELLNDRNSSGQLYVRADYAIGELSFPREHTDTVVSVVSEMLASPQFDDAWVNRIKQGFAANQAQSQSQSASQLWAAARLAILGDEPINTFLSLPDLNVIEEATIDDLRKWHSETLIRNGATIVVTGAINRRDAGNVIDRLLSGLPEGTSQEPAPVRLDFSPRTILLHLPDSEKTTLGVLGQLPPTADGQELTDLLALNYFSRSGNGPLFDAVRTELRASYGFQAGFTNYDRQSRLMFITGEVETEKLAEATQVVLETYDAFRTNPDLSDLDDTRRGLAEGIEQNVRYVNVAAATILELVLDGRDPNDATRLHQQTVDIKGIDVEDRLRSDFPANDRLVVIATSPDASAMPGACIIESIEQVSQCR